MAKIIPMDLIGSMSGKVCGHSDISFAKKGKTQYTMKRCNPRTTPYTEAELARQEKFAQVRAAMKALSEEQKNEYATQFQKSPGKYTTLNGYIFAKEYAKLGE
jgi:TfoX/Sxy family transcriptional regulator of competence genes